MLRTGKVTPEKNNSPKLTMVMSTRTPLQAFQMLRMGHPIDQMAGYYEDQGVDVSPDFYMMDKVQKLHALANYKTMMATAKSDIDKFNAEQANITKEAEQKAAKEQREYEIQEAARKLVTKQQLNNDTKEI